MKALSLALVLMLSALPGWAHQLTVFAFVEAGELVVEAKFSSGRKPVSGEVRLRDAENVLVARYDLGAEGTLRIPLDGLDYGAGLVIEVATGEGHENYWILTPADIAAGLEVTQ